MTSPHAARRPGFTLIELLIVIGLLATLAAISTGTFFRIREGQNSSVTEATLNKLHSLLDAKWKAVLDDAKKSVPDTLVDKLGKDRAVVVWTYAKLKNEFPQSVAEVAKVDLTAVDSSCPVLKPRGVFGSVASPTDAMLAKVKPTIDPASYTPARAAYESAALLHLILTQTGGGGLAMDLSGTQQQTVVDSATGLKYFKDAWGRPVAFVRHAASKEIDTSASRPNPVTFGATTVNVLAVLDPTGSMDTNNPWKSTGSNAAIRTAVQTALNLNLTVQPINFDLNQNLIPTLVSAGPNKEFGTETDWVKGTTDDAVDNILSFRLRREGARGN